MGSRGSSLALGSGGSSLAAVLWRLTVVASLLHSRGYIACGLQQLRPVGSGA